MAYVQLCKCQKKVKQFPNNKPLVTKEGADVLKSREAVCKEGNMNEMKVLQREREKSGRMSWATSADSRTRRKTVLLPLAPGNCGAGYH